MNFCLIKSKISSIYSICIFIVFSFALYSEEIPEKMFWVSGNGKTIHNSHCHYYKNTKGKLYKFNELKFGMKNCKLCGGATAFVESPDNNNLSIKIAQLSKNKIIPDNESSIKIGLSLKEELANQLQNYINNSLKQANSSKTVKVISLFGYDSKMVAIKNNSVDIMEGGFLTFFEFNKRKKHSKVILHACYLKNFNMRMFIISGNIIAHKGDNIAIEDIPNRAIYAVSESSSSGYGLQRSFLGSKGILLNKPINFVKHQELVTDAVASHPNSVGFVGDFINIDESKFSIIAKTPPSPGGVIFADKDVCGSIKTMKIIKKCILKFFDELYKQNEVNRFFVEPLYKDYTIFFPNYKEPITPETQALKHSYNILLIAFIIFIVIASIPMIFLALKVNYFKNLDKKHTQKLLKEVGIKHLKEAIDKKGISITQLKTNISALHKSIAPFKQEHFDLVISDLTKNTEDMLSNTLIQINYYIKNENKKLLPKKNDFSGMLNSFIKFAINVENDEISEYQINEDDLIKIKDIIYLAASFKLLYFYRNPSHHPKKYWYADKHKATHTLHCYAYVIYTLIESKFFQKT